MEDLKLVIGYMTLRELKQVEVIVKRMIKTKEGQLELIKETLK